MVAHCEIMHLIIELARCHSSAYTGFVKFEIASKYDFKIEQNNFEIQYKQK